MAKGATAPKFPTPPHVTVRLFVPPHPLVHADQGPRLYTNRSYTGEGEAEGDRLAGADTEGVADVGSAAEVEAEAVAVADAGEEVEAEAEAAVVEAAGDAAALEVAGFGDVSGEASGTGLVVAGAAGDDADADTGPPGVGTGATVVVATVAVGVGVTGAAGVGDGGGVATAGVAAGVSVGEGRA